MEKQRYFQITIVAVDTMAEDGKFQLTSELIAESFRINPLPQYLKLSDVEVVQVGNNFHIHPDVIDIKNHRRHKLELGCGVQEMKNTQRPEPE